MLSNHNHNDSIHSKLKFWCRQRFFQEFIVFSLIVFSFFVYSIVSELIKNNEKEKQMIIGEIYDAKGFRADILKELKSIHEDIDLIYSKLGKPVN